MLLWSEYSGLSGTKDVPLLLSERSQQMILSVMHALDLSANWTLDLDEIDGIVSNWNDIEKAVAEAYFEISEVQSVDGVPVGSVVWFPSPTIPDKWLLCDGSTYTQAAYPDLFDILEDFQSGTNFDVPELTARYVTGTAPTEPIGDIVGQHEVELVEQNLPAHTHTIPSHTHSITIGEGTGTFTNRVARGSNTNPAANTAVQAAAATVTGSTGSAAKFDNRPQSMAGNFIIRALP